MKKTLKVLLCLSVAVVFSVISVTAYFAEAVYIVNGYSYNIINNTSIALCGWDNSSTELVVPDSLAGRYFASIADYGLEYNDGFTSVDLSQASHLNYIGIDAFRNCSGIAGELTIPYSVTTLSERAFQECTSLPSVVIDANVTTIPKQCFYKCSALETVILPDTLTSIQSFAFADCTALNYVQIPPSVTDISAKAFKNDTNLTLGVYYDSYGYSFAKKNKFPYKILDEITIADVNSDGLVNINDVTAIQRDLAELEQFNELQELAADANRDGFVDISDATAIQMFLAEYEIPYPIGETITA